MEGRRCGRPIAKRPFQTNKGDFIPSARTSIESPISRGSRVYDSSFLPAGFRSSVQGRANAMLELRFVRELACVSTRNIQYSELQRVRPYNGAVDRTERTTARQNTVEVWQRASRLHQVSIEVPRFRTRRRGQNQAEGNHATIHKVARFESVDRGDTPSMPNREELAE